MQSRRPYASHGFARRPHARSRRSVRRLLLILLPGVLCALGMVGLAWAQLRPAQPVANAATPAGPASAPLARLSQLAPARPTAAPTAAPPPLQHQWATSPIDGITIDDALTRQLDQALVGVDGSVGVAVKDLGSGRGAVLDGNLELASASLFKLPILFTVFESQVPLSEELVISDGALAYDSGTMELGAGETLSVAEALERMVTLSDNTSAILLGDRVGAARINANINALGMQSTHYSADRMTTSALDMLDLVELFAQGRAVSPAASADMIHLLLRQRVNDRLPRLLPSEVQVAHKTGNLPGTVNDVGILYGPTSTVAVAALISDTTDETTAATAIARLGLAAYSYFAQQPEVSDRPQVPPAPDRPIPPVWREPHPVPPTPVPQSALVSSAPTLAATRPQPTAVRAAVATPVLPTEAPVATVAPTPAPTVKPTVAPAVPTAKPTEPPPTRPPTPTSAPPPPTVAPPPPTAAPARPPAPATAVVVATPTPAHH